MSEIITETERITLSEVALEDAVFIYTLMNSKTWLHNIGDRGIIDLTDAEDYIENTLYKSYNRFGYGLFKMTLKSENKPIGLCGFVRRKSLDFPDLGFAILPAYEGRGLTKEIAKATLQYGQTKFKMKTVLGVTSENNKASQNILTSIGMKEAGNVKISKDAKSSKLYSITLSE